MKLLSVIAQKPNSTGSGIYLSELVKNFKSYGIDQEIICAVYKDDILHDEDKVRYDRVVFDTADVPIKIAGMSDVMPYSSTKYSDFVSDNNKFIIWEDAFKEKLHSVISRFKPDVIVCHHLYILTAMVIEYIKKTYSNNNTKIFGICHNTDLLQYKKTDLKRDFIRNNINKLDQIFVPSISHKTIAKEIFDIPDSKFEIIGIGYNDKIFYNQKIRHEKTNNKKLLYVGKVSKKKGVLSLIKAINILHDEEITLDIIGGAGDKNEYDEILFEANKSISIINFKGSMSQVELSYEYNTHDIFILPSFSEGIPIVPIEALACGCKVVMSDLPGVKEFYDTNIKNASVKYVLLPELFNYDEANINSIDEFNKRLSKAICESINDSCIYEPELKDITWDNIANKIITKIKYN